MTIPIQAAPLGKKYRVSSDSVWPLRGLDGKTFAERRKKQDKKLGRNIGYFIKTKGDEYG
jgi:hypothetical protein